MAFLAAGRRGGLSLLWPGGRPDQAIWTIPPEVIQDLGLGAILTAICPSASHRAMFAQSFYQLCRDPAVIAYRQDVLADLVGRPELAAALGDLLPLLDELAFFGAGQQASESALHEVTQRVGELELLSTCVARLRAAFAGAGGEPASEGLRALRAMVEALAADESFVEMAAALPEMQAALRTSASITIGVNLDDQLRPEEAVLLAVSAERFSESRLLDRLLGKNAQTKGLGPLHGVPTLGEPGALPGGAPARRAEPMLVPLFRDLARVLEKVTRPIAQELRRYLHLSADPLVRLRPDLIFFVYAAELARRLAARGLSLCRPAIAPAGERVCEVEGAYNLQLALHLEREAPEGSLAGRVVTSDIVLGPRGRIAILTGPNQGGKTTYTQAVGQAQVLAQAGLMLPGARARVSPADAIYTHFPTEERLELGTGRFGDEARRIRAIFDQATRESLVLLNETLATTSAGESLYLARDIVRALRMIGLRAIFTTHLHELAADIDELNASVAGASDVVSLVASVASDAGERHSYRVILGPPTGRSYAERIAARYGIGFEQLVGLLRGRGVVE